MPNTTVPTVICIRMQAVELLRLCVYLCSNYHQRKWPKATIFLMGNLGVQVIIIIIILFIYLFIFNWLSFLGLLGADFFGNFGGGGGGGGMGRRDYISYHPYLCGKHTQTEVSNTVPNPH